MKTTKLLTVLMILALIFSLSACGAADKNNDDDMGAEITQLLAAEPENLEEAAELYKKLMQQENAILTENKELWEKVFKLADKGTPMIEDGTNYGDFLLKTIDSAEDKFSKKELKILRDGAEKIREIEGKLTVLEQKYPGCEVRALDSDMSVPATEGKPEGEGDLMKFPAFEGKDLDGGKVKSDKLFSGNSVTVVNFWFTTCSPCVGELTELDELNKQLAKRAARLSALIHLHLTVIRRRYRKQKKFSKRRKYPTGISALIQTAKQENSPPESTPTLRLTWLTETETL